MKKTARILSAMMAFATLFSATACDGDEACEHVYGEFSEVLAPTCTRIGTAERVCEKCGDVDGKVLPKSEHDWELSSILEEPKDGVAGRGVYGCKNCDEEKTDLVFEVDDGEEDEPTMSVLYIGIPNEPSAIRFIEAAIDAFEEKYKDTSFKQDEKGVAVFPAKEDLSILIAGFQSGRYDLVYLPDQYLTEMPQTGMAENLNDVMNETVYGEEGSIKEKLTVEYQPYWDGNWYSLPYTQYYAGFVYNASLFEKNKWSVPNTTDEMYALCEEMAGMQYKPFMDDYYGLYWEKILNAWTVQYDGVEAYKSYLYEDVTALNGKNGRRYALETLNGFVTNSAFMPQNSLTQTVFEAQAEFLLSQATDKPVGFMPTYESFLWDQKGAIEELEKNGVFVDIKMMKTPVLSSIIGLCETINDDETLSAVVAAVDAGESSYTGVAKEDFARVKEARSLVGAYDYAFHLSHRSDSATKEVGKEFLKFLASDEGLTVAANAGSAHLLLDYEMSQTQVDQYDSLQKSCLTELGEVTRLPLATLSPAYIRYGYGMAFGSYSIMEIMTALRQQSKTVESILGEVIASIMQDKA